MRARIACRSFAAGFALVAMAPTVMAQKAPPVTIFVGSSTGGLYDLTARLWSRHLGRFLDGEPSVLVQNMPGAGGLSATNHLYNLAPQDGSALGVVSTSAVLLALFGDPAARFDPRKFAWIGGRSQETAVCGFWHTSQAKSFEDLRRIETVVASTGPGARSYSHPIMLNALLGTKLRSIAGYPGGSEMSLAIERGEVEGECGWSWGAMKARTSNWLREGKLKVLLQAGYKKNPELPDVPFALDLAPSNEIRAVMEVLLIDTVLAWPLIGPPNMPEARAAKLRAAFDAMMKDAELALDAEKNQLEIDPVSGREMQDIVNRLFELPAPLITQAKAIFK